MLALFAPVIATNTSALAWLDPNWPYRLPLTIDNTAGPNGLTDYATRIELDAGNFDFSLARNRGQDIRFTDSDGVTLIDFWIEDFNSTTDTATLWAEAPSVPALTSLEIYMYFGNPLAEDISSGDATFELYDDFSAGSSGLFGNWQRVLVDGSFDGAHNVVVEDVDGDTKPDLIADAYRANDVVWYRQPADPVNGAWVKYTIDSDLPNVHDSMIGDIDGDEQNDVVSVSLSENWQDYNQGNGSLVWYKKPLDPTAAGANGWTIKQSCPSATGDGAAAVYNGELYVFGGHYLGVSDPRAESYAYNPQTDTWRQLMDMPTARWGQVGVEFNSNIHVFSGMIGGTAVGIHEIYDPETDSWQSSTDGNPLNIHWNRVRRRTFEGKDIQGIPAYQLVCELGVIRKYDGSSAKVATGIGKGFRLPV